MILIKPKMVLKKDRKIGGLVVWENFLELKGFAPENVMLSPPPFKQVPVYVPTLFSYFAQTKLN